MLTEKYDWSSLDARAFSDFLEPMLEYDPNRRATAVDCIRHPWLRNDTSIYDLVVEEEEDEALDEFVTSRSLTEEPTGVFVCAEQRESSSEMAAKETDLTEAILWLGRCEAVASFLVRPTRRLVAMSPPVS